MNILANQTVYTKITKAHSGWSRKSWKIWNQELEICETMRLVILSQKNHICSANLNCTFLKASVEIQFLEKLKTPKFPFEISWPLNKDNLFIESIRFRSITIL